MCSSDLEHDAECAVRAGLNLVEAVPKLGTNAGGSPLQVGVGIATGLVVVADLVGVGAAQEQPVVGETPNLAARLQALAEPGAVVIALSTRTLTGGLFEYRDLGRLACTSSMSASGIVATAPVARYIESPVLSKATPSCAWSSAATDPPWYTSPRARQNGKPCSFERATSSLACRCTSWCEPANHSTIHAKFSANANV